MFSDHFSFNCCAHFPQKLSPFSQQMDYINARWKTSNTHMYMMIMMITTWQTFSCLADFFLIFQIQFNETLAIWALRLTQTQTIDFIKVQIKSESKSEAPCHLNLTTKHHLSCLYVYTLYSGIHSHTQTHTHTHIYR